MGDQATALIFFARASRNTPQQIRDFATWVAAGGASRREAMLDVVRSIRTSAENPFSSRQTTTPTTTQKHQ